MSERYVGQLHSADDLIAAVEEYGFLPFFQNEIPGFSVEELCAPELWFADDADGPWEWKGPAARSGKCLYGKIFNKRAGFVSRDWIPDFANFRRDGYDFDARWDDGLTSYKDKELYETIADEGTVLSKRLKELRNVAEYATPEELFGYDFITSAYQRDPQESREHILRHLHTLLPNAAEKQLETIIKG